MLSRRPAHRLTAGQLVWFLLLSSSVIYFFWTNEADNDLWGHVFFGRQILATRTIPRVDGFAYTTTGQPWVDHEWLSQVLMGTLYEWIGSAGLLVARFAVAAVTFLLLLARVRRRATSAAVWGAVGLLSIATLARGFCIRPQTITYLFVALTLLLLVDARQGRTGRLWLLPGIFLLWANLHGGFVLGVAIVGLFAAADAMRGPERSLTPWLVLLACVAVSALNPYGPRLLLYVWNELSRAHPISEWQPAGLEVAHLGFFTMLGLFVATLPFSRNWRQQGWEVVLALIVGVLALRHQRHTPVFALCAAAPLGAQLENAGQWLARTSFVLSRTSRRLIGAAIVVLALMQFALTARRYSFCGMQIFFNPLEYPVAAVRALQQAGAQGNVAVPLDWGEYVLWFLAPQIKVSLDGRFATVFPERVVEDNFTFFAGAPGWERLLQAYPTQAVLLPAAWPSPIRTLPEWQLAYHDRVADLYVRTDGAERFGLRSIPIAAAPEQPLNGLFP